MGEGHGVEPGIQASVERFHEAFGVPVADRPTLPEGDVRWSRACLIAEEAAEAISALLADRSFAAYSRAITSLFTERLYWTQGSASLSDIARELGDLAYVTYGSAVVAGIPMDMVLAAIHEANMAKLGPDGQAVFGENGKVRKPEGWRPADISGALAVGLSRGLVRDDA